MRAEGKCVNGSPLSAIVTNFYMEFFKHLALEIAPSRSRLWKRCVDDIFVSSGGAQQNILNHLKGFGLPSSSLWSGRRWDPSFPFLDTLARRREGGGLDITVYRNPQTHIGSSTFNPTNQPM